MKINNLYCAAIIASMVQPSTKNEIINAANDMVSRIKEMLEIKCPRCGAMNTNKKESVKNEELGNVRCNRMFKI